MRLIFLGAPGAGKGTQAEKVCEKYNIPAISTGSIIREAIKKETPVGLRAKSHMQAGGLAPDEVAIEVLEKRIVNSDCANGFILDGFPRTIVQAEALDRMGIEIDKVVEIYVPDEIIIHRISGRRICATCGTSYHTEYNPPEVDNKCDKCFDGLVMRLDDKPETIRERLKVYHSQTEPLKEFYGKRGKLVVVDGQGEVAETVKLTLAAIESVEVSKL